MVLTLTQFVGWAKARLRRAHHDARRKEWWARCALPTLRTATNREALQRHLLVAALLADVFDAGGALFRLDAVRRAAFSADRLDPGVALFDDEGLLFHRLADQPLGLLARRLFRHRPAPS